MRAYRKALKEKEEHYWTEIFGILEDTTGDIYHTANLLEKITRHRLKSTVLDSIQ